MNWMSRHKFFVGILALIVLTLLLSALGSDSTNNNHKSQSSQSSSSTAPTYTVEGELGPNNDIKAVLVKPVDATVSRLTAIGKQLDSKYGTASIMRIGVYTDKKQADILLKDPLLPAGLTGAAATAYEKAHVAQYTVNTATHTKTYVITIDGKQTEVKL